MALKVRLGLGPDVQIVQALRLAAELPDQDVVVDRAGLGVHAKLFLLAAVGPQEEHRMGAAALAVHLRSLRPVVVAQGVPEVLGRQGRKRRMVPAKVSLQPCEDSAHASL